ncbi:MAG: DotU family type IV/VI secretion system protein [Deltaproteobacteria bacterium]|nr:DotU family type IV/VI secretion system protein [Deltaproteobacteria bacterium]
MRQETLGRVAGNLIGYVSFFRDARESDRPSATTVRAQILHLLDAFEGSPAARSVTAAELDAARFALVAWADETILLCGWSGQAEWMRELLQARLFGTNKAGDEFYQRLDSLQPEFIQAREVYLVCLAMGFEGRYAGDDARRQELIRRSYETLRVNGMAIDSTTPRHLAEPAYNLAIEVQSGKSRSAFPVVAAWIAGSLIVFGALVSILVTSRIGSKCRTAL